eukprot:gnl/TRDRNA2_/TRDRNA2_48665_c0_seq1.p1 gnl/TRDRNA2_/TRDRNA2_48665_c0~~gnl/TRDRNA2_/TRDRNA2_48665_c0_seq1.p1  ORF type:complete len:143 (+),score=35.84 gnl/TRDRNA2_/TRDRNA2_48665_c0_seq1:61-489(+)
MMQRLVVRAVVLFATISGSHCGVSYRAHDDDKASTVSSAKQQLAERALKPRGIHVANLDVTTILKKKKQAPMTTTNMPTTTKEVLVKMTTTKGKWFLPESEPSVVRIPTFAVALLGVGAVLAIFCRLRAGSSIVDEEPLLAA